MDWNFWVKRPDIGVKRKEYLEILEKLVKTGFIVDMIGVRRSGKSTILKQFADYLIQEKDVDARADLNGDGKVNIIDITKIAKAFGKTE